MSTLNSIVLDVYSQIAKGAQVLCAKNNRSILSAQDIQTAVKIIVPGELAKHAVSEGARALVNYESSEAKKWTTTGFLFCHFFNKSYNFLHFELKFWN